jgi:RNA ligase
MNYTFPTIKDIRQVREAIKDRPEFIEAVRPGYVVFNYMVAHEDSFDCPIRRECRGLIFDESGQVLSRRLHKFFNLGEKAETQMIDWNKPHVVLEKLDGSMITPLVIDGKVRWATKMGITDIGEDVERFVASRPQYTEFALNSHGAKMTPIFEYIAPSNRIVIPYEEENLILIAMRGNFMGHYMRPDYLDHIGKFYNIPVVQKYCGSLDDLKDKVGIEGVVVRFDDGHMVKVKTDWYVAIHKAKENILFEKNVVKLILEEKIDDIIPDLPESDKERIAKYKEELLDNIDMSVFICHMHLSYWDKQQITRREFVEGPANKFGSLLKPILLRCYQKPEVNIRSEIIKMILKHCTSQVKLEELREQFLPEKW